MKGPVICGVDEWSVSAGAVGVARDLARRFELPLVYAHVLEDGATTADGARVLREAVASDHAEAAIEHGHPADGLVALARERQASFLVLGNHGPRSSLLGSISADVARRAPCPVVVVPPTVESTLSRDRRESGAEGGIVRFALGRDTLVEWAGEPVPRDVQVG